MQLHITREIDYTGSSPIYVVIAQLEAGKHEQDTLLQYLPPELGNLLAPRALSQDVEDRASYYTAGFRALFDGDRTTYFDLKEAQQYIESLHHACNGTPLYIKAAQGFRGRTTETINLT